MSLIGLSAGVVGQVFDRVGFVDFAFATYDTTTNASQPVNAVVVQSDGKVILGGPLASWNGVTVGRIVRFNSDGTRDTAFSTNVGTNADDIVNAVALQSDGKILVGGPFTMWSGTTVGNIVRLNPDGTRDTAFSANVGTGSNANIIAIVVQSDGKILVGGSFSSWNGTTVGGIVRLNSNGTLDTTFTTNNGTGADNGVTTIAVQSDGKILVGGLFGTWAGTTVGQIVRLNSDGTREAAFTTNTGLGAQGLTIESIALQSDGKIVVGGRFFRWNGTNLGYIVRLNSDGTRDTTFTTNNGTGADNYITEVALQSDGKIVVGGAFTTWNGTTVNRVVRLNSDGTRETAFTTNAGAGLVGGDVYAFAFRSDGKIVVGGQFTTYNNATVNRLVQLNTDGTRDTSVFAMSYSANTTVSAVALQSDGKILVGGQFTAWNNVTVGRIVRLDSDGTRDTAFTTNTGTAANGTVSAVALQSDGKILVGGQFTAWNGTTVGRIVRLNSDGTRDTTFTTNTGTAANSTVNEIAVQSDGKIVIGGLFATWNGTTVNRIVWLNSDGTRDTAFTTNTGTAAGTTMTGVNAIALQSDGKILLGGLFATWNGTTVNRVVRLNSDGTRDTAFTTNTGTAANGTVSEIALQSDGKILVGGFFTTWNGTTVGRIVRLNSDGTRDTTFTTNTGTAASSTVNAIALQSDGKILLGGAFATWNGTTVGYIVRLNSDGTRDATFTINANLAANNTVNTLAVQSDGKMLLGGQFTSFNTTLRSYIARLLAA